MPNPAIVVEVLSPSTAKMDLSLKLEGYFSLPSMVHYLVIDPDKPLVIHHQRGPGATILTTFVATKMLRLEGACAVPALDVDLTEVLAIA